MKTVDLDPITAAAQTALAHRLAVAANDGRAAPCLVDPDPFTSEVADDRGEAVAACLACPARAECARLALAADERSWVWAGVDLTEGWANADRRAELRQELAAVAVGSCG